MDTILQSFRDLIHRPETMPTWSAWWAANDSIIRETLPKIEYLRLKRGGIIAAEDYLHRQSVFLDPIALDASFLADLLRVNWLESCGQPMTNSVQRVVQVRSLTEAEHARSASNSDDFRLKGAVDLYNHIAHISLRFHHRRFRHDRER